MNRLDLVIGNSNYLNAENFNNSQNDARDICRVLQK